jgi:hypothetical protein
LQFFSNKLVAASNFYNETFSILTGLHQDESLVNLAKFISNFSRMQTKVALQLTIQKM